MAPACVEPVTAEPITLTLSESTSAADIVTTSAVDCSSSHSDLSLSLLGESSSFVTPGLSSSGHFVFLRSLYQAIFS